MKNIFALFLLAVLLSGCASNIFEERKNNDIKKCEFDSQCVLVNTISGLNYIPDITDTCGCECTTAINAEYLGLWEQKSRELDGKLQCGILCKTCPSHTEAVCIKKVCAPR